MTTHSLLAWTLLIASACSAGGTSPDLGPGHDLTQGPGQDQGQGPDLIQSQCPLEATCKAADPSCIGWVDNSTRQFKALRMSRIRFTSPKILSDLSKSEDLAKPRGVSCGVFGTDLTNWVLKLVPTSNLILIGSAEPAGPSEYPYIDKMYGPFRAQQINYTMSLDVVSGVFASSPAAYGVVLVLNSSSTGPAPLPLTGFVIGGKVSQNYDCIGSYDRASCGFAENGSLAGHVTLEDADRVDLPQLKQSLCVYLGGASDGAAPIAHCKRSGATILSRGDWCSSSNMPGGCGDSVRIEAGYAAGSVY